MKNRISGIINIFISLFLLTAINTFLQPCQGVMEMPCGYSVKAADLVLIVLLVVNIGKLFVSDTKGKLMLQLSTVAASVELLLVPQIGRCQIASMTCNTHTFPALYIGALLMLVLTAVLGAADLLGDRRKKNADSQ